MTGEEFGNLIKRGDADGVRRALEIDPALAVKPIRWYLNQQNESDPLHYVSDCVGHGWLTNGREDELARLLIARGAHVNGDGGRETPLIGATSMGVGRVAHVLIDADADLEARSVFGARALHWAAWMGNASSVARLLARGAQIEVTCSEFGATPLFWAVHGYGPDGPKSKADQVGAARLLIGSGARVQTTNKDGQSAIELAKQCSHPDMYDLLLRSG